MDLMRTKLKDSESEKEKYHNALLAAETRADRLQSGTVSALQVRKQDKQEPPEEKEKTEEPERKLSSSPAVSGLVNQLNWWELFSDPLPLSFSYSLG